MIKSCVFRNRTISQVNRTLPFMAQRLLFRSEWHDFWLQWRFLNRALGPAAIKQFVVVQSLNCGRLVATPGTAAHQASLSFTIPWSLLKLMSIESVIPSHHLILCHPLLLLPSIFPSISVFSSESVLRIRWPKYWSFSFSISPSNEYSRLISFRMDWFDLLAVQGTLKSLLQYHSSKASILWCSALASVHDYWKDNSFDYLDLCQQSNVSAIKYTVQICHSFPSKEQTSLNFMVAVTVCSDFEAQENKICHCIHFSPLLFAMK